MLTATREFYALFFVITWLGISTLSQINRIKKFYDVYVRQILPKFLKAPRGLAINRLQIIYRIKKITFFQKNFFVAVLTYIVRSPAAYSSVSDWIRRFTSWISIFSPNMVKYGQEKLLYLVTFQALKISGQCQNEWKTFIN